MLLISFAPKEEKMPHTNFTPQTERLMLSINVIVNVPLIFGAMGMGLVGCILCGNLR